MTDETAPNPTPAKRPRWPKFLLWGGITVFVVSVFAIIGTAVFSPSESGLPPDDLARSQVPVSSSAQDQLRQAYDKLVALQNQVDSDAATKGTVDLANIDTTLEDVGVSVHQVADSLPAQKSQSASVDAAAPTPSTSVDGAGLMIAVVTAIAGIVSAITGGIAIYPTIRRKREKSDSGSQPPAPTAEA